MEIKDATQIVNSFAGVAEISAITSGGQAAPLSMLPYPLPIIEKAIVTYMETLIRDRQYSEKARNYLKTGYTMLSVFIPDEKADIVQNGQKVIEHCMADGDDNRTSDREMDAAWEDYNESMGILEAIQNDMSERQERIDALEVEFLLRAAGYTPKAKAVK